MDWAIYLLSICDNFHAVRVASLCVFVPCAVLWGFVRAMAADETGDDRKLSLRSCRFLMRIMISAAIIAAVASLMPTQKSVMRAYIMIEGAKVVNAPNAEKAITEFTKRVDRIIKVIEKK